MGRRGNNVFTHVHSTIALAQKMYGSAEHSNDRLVAACSLCELKKIEK